MARRWRVRVCIDKRGEVGRVVLTRKRSPHYQEGLLVASLDLTRDDAEEQIAEARAKATSLMYGIGTLEALGD